MKSCFRFSLQFYWNLALSLQGVVNRLSLQASCGAYVDAGMKGGSSDNEIRLAVVGAERTGKSGE